MGQAERTARSSRIQAGRSLEGLTDESRYMRALRAVSGDITKSGFQAVCTVFMSIAVGVTATRGKPRTSPSAVRRIYRKKRGDGEPVRE